MSSLFSLVIWLVILYFIIRSVLRRKHIQKNGKVPHFHERERGGVLKTAHDGHPIPAEDDISCTRFGHKHDTAKDPLFTEEQYIVHDEPVEGYINLNGKILKRSEADEYMRRHG